MRSNLSKLAVAALLVLAAQSAKAQETPVLGTFTFAGQAAKGKVTIGLHGGEISYVATLSNGTVRKAHGPFEGQPPLPGGDTAAVGTASWVLTLSDAANGFTSRLTNTVGDAESTTVELRPLGNGRVSAVFRKGTAVIGKESLTRERAVLLIAAEAYDKTHVSAFNAYAGECGSYYKAKGYTRVDKIPGQNWEQVIAYMVQCEADGVTYERVVSVGHGGWDGPFYWGQGENSKTSQVSTVYHEDMWPALVDAFRRATTSDAKIMISACHAGGSNVFERALEEKPRIIWVDDLAKGTGRTVAGPAGKTSTEYSLQNTKALLEGEGVTVQECRLATGTQARTIKARSGIR